ncbi:MAG: hypothetical protein COB35_03485 [Gammaproteobacteria bacterium]|nr:MAG: hypothetical protein COB35_03485 [Gammaproteobacteria bacterium]
MSAMDQVIKIVNFRALPQSEQLHHKLVSANYNVFSQPLFEHKNNTDESSIKQLLLSSKAKKVVFVSRAAVEFAHQAYALTLWQASPQMIFIAVGQGTKLALQQCGISEVLTPAQENSEGLLALSELNNVANQDIIIVRGDNGRELLAQQLTKRRASVHYLSSYQKVWYNINCVDLIANWYDPLTKNSAIICLVITSVALLEKALSLLLQCQAEHIVKKHYYWLVVSQRIALKAQQLNLAKIIVAQGANDKAILMALETLKLKH